MSKTSATLIIIFVLAVITFATWQMFCGNFEGAVASLPFIIIIYFFVRPGRNDAQRD